MARISGSTICAGVCIGIFAWHVLRQCGKRILLPMASVSDIPTGRGELFAKFQRQRVSLLDPSAELRRVNDHQILHY